eukprot:gene23772-11671_t
MARVRRPGEEDATGVPPQGGSGELLSTRSPTGANYVIGGVKVQQWRQRPTDCHRWMEPLFDHNLRDACRREADSRGACGAPPQPPAATDHHDEAAAAGEGAAARRDEFFERCFEPWSGPGDCDRESFTENAHYLDPRRVNRSLSPCGVDPMGESSKLAGGADTGRGLIPVQGIIPMGLLNRQYSCDGYAMILPISVTKAEAHRALEELRDNNWIDVATRMVMVEFYTFGQNTAQVVRHRYMVEASAAGGWETSVQTVVFQLWQWEHNSPATFVAGAIVTLALMTFFCVLNVAKLCEEWRRAQSVLVFYARYGHARWCGRYAFMLFRELLKVVIVQNAACLYDLLLYLALFGVWVVRLYVISIGLTQSNILCTETYPRHFAEVADLSLLSAQVDGFGAIFVFLRLLGYFGVNSNMKLIIRTVARAATSIVWLVVALFVTMSGFSLCAWVLFGDVDRDYNGYFISFNSLVHMMLGEADFDEMVAHRPVAAQFFIIIFFVIIIIVLLNLAIAVVSTAYDS